jgi:predicted ATPase
MKLDKLWIDDFKNLKDIEIDFDQDELVTVVIGWNGAGKSNVIEALVIIFKNLDLGGLTKFSYRLEYLCHGKRIHINADKEQKTADKQYQITYCKVEEVEDESAWKSLRFSKLNNSGEDKFLPSNVFGYYSGPSDRLAEHFYEHQRKFRDQLLYPKKHKLDEKTLPLRPFFYAQKVHSNFVLLSFFLGKDKKIQAFLKEKLNIHGLESVLFVLNKPDWKSNEGDPRFWNANGVVQPFLDRLFSASLAPMKQNIKVPHPMKNPENVEALFLYLKDIEALREVGTQTSDKDFFKLLESIYFSNLIHEVRIRVQIKDEAGKEDTLTFRELSEGEQQLLAVLGLLRFTREDESLFLLDEPDTHLNPAWSMEYINYLHEIAGLDEHVDQKKNSHIVLATHDPVVLSTLRREQIQIMKRDESSMKVYAEPPSHDPKGLGVTGILMSDMFGLRSDLDGETLASLDEHAQLLASDDLTEQEENRFEELKDSLGSSGFMHAYSDPYFNAFVKEWVRLEDSSKYTKPFLNDKDRTAMKEAAKLIMEKLNKEVS